MANGDGQQALTIEQIQAETWDIFSRANNEQEAEQARKLRLEEMNRLVELRDRAGLAALDGLRAAFSVRPKPATLTAGEVDDSRSPAALEYGDQETDLREYVALAEKLGLEVAREAKAELFREWLLEENLPVYDMAKVEAWMDQQVRELNAAKAKQEQEEFRAQARSGTFLVGAIQTIYSWQWVPLFPPTRANIEAAQSGTGLTFGLDMAATPVYQKPVPMPVLETISKVRGAFPDAECFVSDIVAEKRPDPFLMVRYGGQEFVIERWDEPGFRG